MSVKILAAVLMGGVFYMPGHEPQFLDALEKADEARPGVGRRTAVRMRELGIVEGLNTRDYREPILEPEKGLAPGVMLAQSVAAGIASPQAPPVPSAVPVGPTQAEIDALVSQKLAALGITPELLQRALALGSAPLAEATPTPTPPTPVPYPSPPPPPVPTATPATATATPAEDADEPLDTALLEKLAAAGIETEEQIRSASDETLDAIPGVGPAAIKTIRAKYPSA